MAPTLESLGLLDAVAFAASTVAASERLAPLDPLARVELKMSFKFPGTFHGGIVVTRMDGLDGELAGPLVLVPNQAY